MITKEWLLDELGLLNNEGYLIGKIRLIDIEQDYINEIIKQYNEDLQFLGRRINENNKALYNRLFKPILNYNQFINSVDVKNEKTNEVYRKNIDGYYCYIQTESKELGNFFLDWFEPYFSDKIRACHTYITGESGSGKSEQMNVIIQQHIIKNNCSVVVLDPHGDLAKQVYKSKVFLSNEQEKRLITLEPNYDLKYTPIINIFDQFIIRNEFDLDRISQEYSNAFSNIFQDLGEAPSSRMKTILGHCITVILRKKDGSIWDLLRFMTANSNDLIALGGQDNNPATAQFFKDEFQDETYKHTKNGIYDRLQSLLKNQIFSGLITGKSTINIPNAINTNKVLIINLSRGAIGTQVSQSFGRLIISIIQIAGLERDIIIEKQRPTTHVFIDEFSNYISNTIIEILAELRKYKVFLTLINQYVGQDLDANSNKGILGNTKMKIIGQGSYGNSVAIAKELQIKPEQITELHRGEFYLQYRNPKTGKATTIKIKGKTDYLGNSYEMNNNAYNSIKIEQIKRFYVDRSKYTPPLFEGSKSDFINDSKREPRNTTSKRKKEAPKLDLDF